MADDGVVWREKAVVVEWSSRKDCFVFGAVGNILDDFFDFFVVRDVFVAELVESLFECAVVVVLVVCDVVQPCDGHGVLNQVMVMTAVAVVSIDNVSGHFGDCLHVSVSVRFVSVSTCCLNEFREHVPALFGLCHIRCV